MTPVEPHFDLPLDLPHAGRVASRLVVFIDTLRPSERGPSMARSIAVGLAVMLRPCLDRGENPPEPEASRLRERAAAEGRRLVDALEREAIASDSIGKAVRNLFECLTLGVEGTKLSLRAGENPQSLQRPV